jgi:hypothetical protein
VNRESVRRPGDLQPSVTEPDEAPQFGDYVHELLWLAARGRQEGLSAGETARVHAELNGNAGRIYRERVDLDVRRDRGTFFTGHLLARRLVAPHVDTISAGGVVLDPACGLGDLLLAAARQLPVLGDLRDTVLAWGSRLHGKDLRYDFIAATKARLYLLALARGAAPTTEAPLPEDCFPNISRGDFFGSSDVFEPEPAQVVLMNPPYGRVDAPADAQWAAGGVSAASIFALEGLRRLPPNSRMSAILPDVLRSGTRYRAWRAAVERTATIDAVTAVGRFDSSTDVDVFIMSARAGTTTNSSEWWPSPPRASATIGDCCRIMVGPVVPHRHPEDGPEHPYIHARLLPPGGRIRAGQTRRRFAGTVILPPFVAIRRTCRPVERGPRVLATVIEGDEPVAVENHLIAVRPQSGELADCDNLLTMLSSDAVTRWLDERIRCRHLTVSAVRELPWLPSPS